MEPIRLIGLDLDGTLLDSGKHISQATYDALARAADMGVHLVPVTGRPHEGIPKLVRDLPFVEYFISCNGAAIRRKNGDFIRAATIPHERTLEVADILAECHEPYEALVLGGGYGEGWVYEAMMAVSPNNQFLRRYIQETRHIVPDLSAYIKEKRMEAEEFFVMTASTEGLAEVAENLKKVSGIHVVFPAAHALEVTAEGVDKGEALLHLASHLGVPQKSIMALGDSGNDLKMLMAAEVSVAMGNAEEQVKSLSKFVTDSNDEDGVAKAISRFVLERAIGKKTVFKFRL